MIRAMIISLGGTPEPLVRAIAEHRPQFVAFLASHESVSILGKVMEALEAEGINRPAYRVELIEDVNDLVHCYEKSLACARFIKERQFRPEEVAVDYTGGTKNMSVALALASAGKGYSFSYVGGSSRTKGGLGIVDSGSEVVYTSVSPWQIFAVQEWQHLVLHVNCFQYEAALTLVRETRGRLPASEQTRWQGLEETLEGLLHWDRFNHSEALPRFKEGLQTLENWSRLKNDQVLDTYVREGQSCLAFLQRMAHESRGFKIMTRLLLADLVANAERRAAQGRYDDAMARLYRALEMQGQIALMQRWGVSTSEVPPAQIPEDLRQEYQERYLDRETGRLKLPLMATFRLLHALHDPAGEGFKQREEDFRKLLSARNASILAHGSTPVSENAFTRLRDLLREALDLRETITFPQLRFPF